MDTSSDSLSDLSSELSSIGSRSPTPPFSYPSPQSSQHCDNISTEAQETTSRKRPRGGGEDPTRKKRKTEGEKSRKTERLDLRTPREPGSPEPYGQLNVLLQALRKRRKIVVIAGAGISTSAGIPDFRSSNGLFNTLRSENKVKGSGKHLFDASVYQTDSSTSSFHDMVRTLSTLVKDAQPTEFHQMLATLADEGRLLRLYTQNVDGIDTALPPLETSVPLNPKGPWPKTIQLHGSLEKMVCSKCSNLSPFDGSLFSGPLPPPCSECIKMDEIRTDHAGKRSHGVGRLRPRMVLYNEHNPDEEAIGRVVTSDLRARPDAVIVVGTSLEIPGVKRIVREMCAVVRGRKSGLTAWINRNSPPTVKEFEDCWDLIVAGDCDTVAKEAKMRRWNEQPVEGVPVTEAEAETAKKQEGELQVILPSPKKASPGLMTPAASPRPQAKDLPKQKIKLLFKKIPSASDSESKSSSRSSSKSRSKTTKANNLPIAKVFESTAQSVFIPIKNLKSEANKPAKATKPKRSRAKAAPDAGMAKLTHEFKVKKYTHTSPVMAAPAAGKALDSTSDWSRPQDSTSPMLPISPSSARSNGPNVIVNTFHVAPNPTSTIDSKPSLELVGIGPTTPNENISLNLEFEGRASSSPTESPKGRLKAMSEEIVSSGNSPPRGMESLLN